MRIIPRVGGLETHDTSDFFCSVVGVFEDFPCP